MMKDHQMTPDPDVQPQFYDGILAKRFFAWVIDVVLIAVICVLVLPFTAFTAVFFFPVFMLVVGFIYRVATISGSSATWGMRVMAMELRTGSDRPLDLGTAFLHTLGYTICITVAPLQLISVALMWLSARGQGLPDMFVNTVALRRRRDI